MIKIIQKVTPLSGGILALSLLGHISVVSASIGFVEDFSGGTLPSQLEAVGGEGSSTSPGSVCCGSQVGGPVFEDGHVRFQGLDTRRDRSGGLRSYLRTIETNYSSVNFVAEVTVTVLSKEAVQNVGRNIVFFGLGPILPVNTWGDPARIVGNSISIELLPENFSPRVRVYNWTTPAQVDLQCGGTGTHRMRLEWNAQTKIAVTSIDQDYTGGNFVADCVLAPISSFPDNLQLAASTGDDFLVNEGDVSGLTSTVSEQPNNAHQANASIYIGGDWDSVFDDFEVTIHPASDDNYVYQWTQTAPATPVITLSDATTANPSFTAPNVDMDTTFTFELSARSGGLKVTDTVDVTVVDFTDKTLVFGNTYISTGASAEIYGSMVANTYTVVGASSVVKGNIQSGTAVTTGASNTLGPDDFDGVYDVDAGTAVTIGAGTNVTGDVNYGTALTLGAGATIASQSQFATQPNYSSGEVIYAQDYFNGLTSEDELKRNILESTISQDLILTPINQGAYDDDENYYNNTVVYNATSLTIAAGKTLTLSGSHDWVFNITDMLVLGANTKIVFDDNSTGSVIWNIGGYASIGAGAEIVGTALAGGYVTTGMGAKVTGADTNSYTSSQSFCGGLFSATSYVTIGASGIVSCDKAE